jgi:hypothetical protein
MRIFKLLCPNHGETHLKDAEQLLAPLANRVMPLSRLQPGKCQQQNKATLEDMCNEAQ